MEALIPVAPPEIEGPVKRTATRSGSPEDDRLIEDFLDRCDELAAGS